MVKVLLTVLSSEGCENFPEAVPVIAEIPLVLPSSEGHGKLGTTGTTVWFTVEYCYVQSWPLHHLHYRYATQVEPSTSGFHSISNGDPKRPARLIKLVPMFREILDPTNHTFDQFQSTQRSAPIVHTQRRTAKAMVFHPQLAKRGLLFKR